MLTDRLFYKDSMIQNFEAQVMECRQGKNRFEIRLDRTAFYPEGGGQPYDIGKLGETEVFEVQEKDDEIWHYTKEAIPEGTRVKGQIDWARRWDLMQQHSGEHIVSGMIHSRYGYNNVGFHMGPETITIDFDGEIPENELQEIELAANQYVWEDHPLEISWPKPEELEKIPYRSKKELTAPVRIVTWPGADICACCGVHIKSSGQAGQIMLLSSQRSKGGIRIEMLCGVRALKYSNQLKEQNKKISNLLSVKWKETASGVEKLYQECQENRFRLVGMEYEKIEKIAREKEGQGNQLLFDETLSPDCVRKMAAEVMETCGGLCAVFCGNDKEGYRYALGEKNGDLRQLVKEMNQQLQGRGGGKPFFAQGSVRASRKEICKFFQEKRAM